jgi:CheY-like chemotaxis protein
MDIVMGGLDGLETCGMLKSNPSTMDTPENFD